MIPAEIRKIESSRHNWQLLMDALHPFCFLADG
jgi:hypothetical protein